MQPHVRPRRLPRAAVRQPDRLRAPERAAGGRLRRRLQRPRALRRRQHRRGGQAHRRPARRVPGARPPDRVHARRLRGRRFGRGRVRAQGAAAPATDRAPSREPDRAGARAPAGRARRAEDPGFGVLQHRPRGLARAAGGRHRRRRRLHHLGLRARERRRRDQLELPPDRGARLRRRPRARAPRGEPLRPASRSTPTCWTATRSSRRFSDSRRRRAPCRGTPSRTSRCTSG